MSGDIVNLRQARKRRARAAARQAADANAARHGTPPAERARRDAERDAADRRLDGHLRDGAKGSDAGPDDADA